MRIVNCKFLNLIFIMGSLFCFDAAASDKKAVNGIEILKVVAKSNSGLAKADMNLNSDVDVLPEKPKSSLVPVSFSTVTVGTFKENVERLAKEQGFSPVIWDKRVKSCVWEQIQGYTIPEKEPREIIAYYASTLDFKTVFSDVDKHVQLIYFGPKTRIQNCEN